MGEFRDMLDMIKDLQGEIKQGVSSIGAVKRPRSISASATDGICYFPVVVDDSIPLEDALIISRALERKYATFVLTTLTMNPYMQLENGEISAADYVKKFHQNMRVKSSNKIGFNLTRLGDVNEAMAGYDIDTSGLQMLAEATAWKIYQHVSSGSANSMNAKWNFTIEEMLTPSIANDFGKVHPILEAKKRTIESGDPNITNPTDSGAVAPEGSMDGIARPHKIR